VENGDILAIAEKSWALFGDEKLRERFSRNALEYSHS
jgi:hypothetical protein